MSPGVAATGRELPRPGWTPKQQVLGAIPGRDLVQVPDVVDGLGQRQDVP